MSTTTITTIISILGGAWSIFKFTGLYNKYISGKWDKAIEALAAGVVESLQTYVWVKEKTAPLTSEEKTEARKLALAAAEEIGKRNGIDIRKTLGDAFVDKYLTEQLNKLNK